MTPSQAIRRLRRLAQGRAFYLLLAAFVGAAAFLVLYGATPLDVTNDRWILPGYDEWDILQHYAGWMGYRLSPWRFPLGLAEKIAVGSGTLISYTDSIPWLAVFFRVFRRFLPEVFQYFGIYGLFCFMMQGAAGYLLIEYKTHSRLYALLGSVLFVFSPIMIERMFRHTALASHWLILFSLLLYFRHRDQKQRFTWAFFLLLETLSIGIHPYFLPMVACFSLLCTIEDCRRRKWRSVPAFLGQQALVLLAGYLLGAIGGSIKAGRGGFGYFSMNLNALFNPSSRGNYTWSRLLPVLGQTLGNYDGFNYLGLGVLAALPLLPVLWFFSKKRGAGRAAAPTHPDASAEKKAASVAFKAWLLRNIWLLFACLGFTMFALSNVVTLNGQILFEYPLPGVILDLCNIFRASSRMFYPVYYLIFLSILVSFPQIFNRSAERGNQRWTYLTCALLCIIQLWDMRGMIAEKREGMASASEMGLSNVFYSEPALLEAAQNSERIILLGGGDRIPLAVWGLKNGMDIHFSIDSSISDKDMEPSLLRADEILQSIYASKDLQHTIIVTSAENFRIAYMSCANAKEYKYKDTYIIYQGSGSADDPG